MLVAGSLVVGLPGLTPPATAVDGPSCLATNSVDPSTDDPSTEVSEPLVSLQVPEAQRLVRRLTGKEPGDGVQVAVVDSGVRGEVDQFPGATHYRVDSFTTDQKYHWGQGTSVAGIIAGASRATKAVDVEDDDLRVGIAPGATIVDMRVYDVATGADDELATPEADGLAAGLMELEPLVGRRGIRIINVSLMVERSDALDEAIAAVTAKGAIVVAAAGDREADYELGEDYADEVWPAGYATAGPDRPANPRVVAVTTTAPGGADPTGVMVQSSAIDVAVPTALAVSYGLNGTACTYADPTTVVAAAEVSGIFALLFSVYPDDNADQAITRLEDTATGGGVVDPDHPDTRVGRGIVQPLEALTRAIAPAKDGTIVRSTQPEEDAEPAALPEKEPDVLADTRSDAVWWGLFGGGALLLAVLLRPVLSRRRPASRDPV